MRNIFIKVLLSWMYVKYNFGYKGVHYSRSKSNKKPGNQLHGSRATKSF